MAKHLIIAFYFITYIIGFSFLLLIFLGWLKSRRKDMKYLLLSVVALTLILLEQMVTAYEMINIIESRSLYVVFTGISAIGCGLMIYSLTRFVKLLTRKALSRKMSLLLISASVLPVLLSLLYFITMERALLWIAETILFGFVLHNILDLLMNMDKIEYEIVKPIIRRVIAFSLMMIPIQLLDLFIERIPGIKHYFPYGLLSVFLFYSVLSIMGLYYIIKNNAVFFDMRPIEVTMEAPEVGNDAEGLDGIWEEYKITAREKEIILLLINGHTYHEIELQLSISLPTVKTHVSHVYKKLNVKNKIELVNLCRNHTKV